MPEDKNPRTLLAEAIRKRDELNTFIKVLHEMIGSEAQTPPDSGRVARQPVPRSDAQTSGGEFSDPLTAVYPGMFFGKTQTQATKLLLEKVHRPIKTKLIWECLQKGGLSAKGGKQPLANLWGILDRNKETFVLVPKAGWGLVEWHEPSVIAKYRKEGGRENDEK